MTRRPTSSTAHSSKNQPSRGSSLEPLEGRQLLSLTVTNTFDAGPGSLRQAILDADASASTAHPQAITFAIGTGPQTIRPQSPLPNLNDGVTLDAATQPGYAGRPIVQLDGSQCSAANSYGLKITGSAVTVKGLIINHFNADGIFLNTGGGDVIQGNYIGTDASGTTAAPNATHGLLVVTGNNLIGGTTAAQRNVISGNGAFGILLYTAAASGNVIEGNYIGTDATGEVAVPNASCGIGTLDGGSNVIGGTAAGAGNVVSGNASDGILLKGNDAGTTAANNLIAGNFIGTDATGTHALGNGSYGVEIQTRGNLVGGTTAGARNVVSSNAADGIVLYLAGAVGNTVQGNYVGTDATGTVDLGNHDGGVVFTDGPTNNLVGGLTAAARNVISGNDAEGVGFYSGAAGNVVEGNYVGTDATGTRAVANGTAGQYTYGIAAAAGALANTVGGTAAGAGNLVSGNIGSGIAINGADGTQILGNHVGTAADGISPLANTADGIFLMNTSNCFVSANATAFNAGDAIHVVGTSTGDRLSANVAFSNVGLGINLDWDRVTANHAANSLGGGANHDQNFPTLTGAQSGGTSTVVTGTLTAVASTTYRVEFFADAALDAGGQGSGRTYLGFTTVQTDAAGNASFSASVAGVSGGFVSATATSATGDTSELSAARQVTVQPTPTPTPAPTPTPTPAPSPTPTPTPAPKPTPAPTPTPAPKPTPAPAPVKPVVPTPVKPTPVKVPVKVHKARWRRVASSRK